MTDQILQFDQWLFHLINGQLHNSLFDAIMPYWRNKYFWIPVYVFLISFLLINWKKRGLIILLFGILAVGAADLTSSKVIKPLIERVRPCNNPFLQQEVRELVRCGSGYSFTSSHATNHFALGYFLFMVFGIRFRRGKWLLLLWAATIAYGQVYVGVHYPLDVFTGSVLGALIGGLCYEVMEGFYRRKTASLREAGGETFAK